LFKIKKEILKDFFILILFKAVLDLSYIIFVNKLYAYSGFYLHLNFYKLIESWMLLWFVFIFLPHQQEKISAIGLQLLFLLMIVPILSLYGLLNGPRIYVYFIILSFSLTIVCTKIFPSIKITKIKGSGLFLFLLLTLFIAFIYIYIIHIRGIPNLKALNLYKVYEIRKEAPHGVFLMGYLVVWLANVLNCFYIGFAWYRRKYILLSFFLFLQFFLYLIMAHKYYLFGPILLLFFLYFLKKKNFLRFSMLGLIGIILASLFLHKFNITSLPGALFVRRTLFVPAQISFQYYDYFSNNEKMYLSHSKVGLGLHENPYASYNLPYAKFMGLMYNNNPNRNLNTGYMGDAYMNFGYSGMLIFSFILAIGFILADIFSRNTSIFVTMGAMIIPISNLVNGALFTNMLTGGFMLSLLVILLYDNRKYRWILKK
jgi:hypothetical protein